jgi:hypothetical protein
MKDRLPDKGKTNHPNWLQRNAQRLLVVGAVVSGGISASHIPPQENPNTTELTPSKTDDDLHIKAFGPLVDVASLSVENLESDVLPNPKIPQISPLLSAFMPAEAQMIPEGSITIGHATGDIAIVPVFVECNGDTCTYSDWKSDQMVPALKALDDASRMWETQINSHYPFADLDLQRLPARIVETTVEPTSLPSSEEETWINDVLRNVPQSGSYYDKTIALNKQAMHDTGASQAFTVYIVKGERFKDGRRMYAYKNGPFFVMPVDEGAAVIEFGRPAHEMGHQMGMDDQYLEANSSCVDNDNALRQPNHNYNNNCPTNNPSIMRSTLAHVTDTAGEAQGGLVLRGNGDLLVAGTLSLVNQQVMKNPDGSTTTIVTFRRNAPPELRQGYPFTNGINSVRIVQKGRVYDGIFVDGQSGGLTETVVIVTPKNTGSIVVSGETGKPQRFIMPGGEDPFEIYFPQVGR